MRAVGWELDSHTGRGTPGPDTGQIPPSVAGTVPVVEVLALPGRPHRGEHCRRLLAGHGPGPDVLLGPRQDEVGTGPATGAAGRLASGGRGGGDADRRLVGGESGARERVDLAPPRPWGPHILVP